jgi:hypothetical protein
VTLLVQTRAPRIWRTRSREVSVSRADGDVLVPVAVGAIAQCSAEDTFAVPPQYLEVTIPTSVEPKEWTHLQDSAVKPVAALGLRRYRINVRAPHLDFIGSFGRVNCTKAP